MSYKVLGRPQLVQLLLIASMSIALVTIAAQDSVSQTPSPHIRVEDASKAEWSVVDEGDHKDVDSLVEVTVTTPPDTENVDVVVTTSLTYESTRGGSTLALAAYSKEGEEGFEALRPGWYRLQPSRLPTTATLQWISRLPAQGAVYTFVLYTQASDSSGNGFAKTTGDRTSIVVDVLPAD